jgi:hypothetical protein
MAHFRFFSKLDLTNGYWHLPAADSATKDLTAFEVPGLGQFRWTRLAQGLKHSPSIFQRFMDSILDPYRDWARAYIDDTIIGADTAEELDTRLHIILDLFTGHGLLLNKDKSILHATELPILGFTLKHGSILPDSTYIKDLASFPIPSDKKGLRRFLGKLSHVLPHYQSIQRDRAVLLSVLNSSKAASSVRIIGNSLASFHNIQAALASPTALGAFNPRSSGGVVIHGDAGSTGFAAVCRQLDDHHHDHCSGEAPNRMLVRPLAPHLLELALARRLHQE